MITCISPPFLSFAVSRCSIHVDHLCTPVRGFSVLGILACVCALRLLCVFSCVQALAMRASVPSLRKCTQTRTYTMAHLCMHPHPHRHTHAHTHAPMRTQCSAIGATNCYWLSHFFGKSLVLHYLPDKLRLAQSHVCALLYLELSTCVFPFLHFVLALSACRLTALCRSARVLCTCVWRLAHASYVRVREYACMCECAPA